MKKPPKTTLTDWPAKWEGTASDALLDMAVRRVATLDSFITAQDAKAATLFGFSVGLLAASGFAGRLRFELSLPVGLTAASAAATVVAWWFAFVVLKTRRYETGENLKEIESWEPISGDELRSVSIEVLTDSFETLEAAMSAKGPALRWLIRAVALQALLTFFVLATR